VKRSFGRDETTRPFQSRKRSPNPARLPAQQGDENTLPRRGQPNIAVELSFSIFSTLMRWAGRANDARRGGAA
jgi:hypothetical protein